MNLHSISIDAHEEQCAALDAQASVITKDIKKRRKKWVSLRGFLSHITNEKFDVLLRLNQYSGTLVWKHKEGKLDITVQKESETNEVELTDVKGLRLVALL